MTEIRLPIPAYPYRFDLLLEFVRRIAYPARLVVNRDQLWRFIDGHLLSFHQVDDTIVIRGAGVTAQNEARIAELSRRTLGLCYDQSAFYEAAQSDESLWQIIEPLVGLPLHCTETVFEALVTLIIEQHISWKTAIRSQRSLMQLFCDSATVGQTEVYDFPAPDQLACLTREALKPLKITNRRIDLIIDIAAALCRGDLDLESICDLPPKQACKPLLDIKGVGPWTASNVIGRACGNYPFVSHNDVALQAAVQRYFHAGAGEKSAAQVRDALEPYGEFAGLAGHYVLLRWVMDNYPPVAA